jgi:hypothetical protein
MKAVIENTEGLYLIKIYGSDGLCDTFVVENIYYSEEGMKEVITNGHTKKMERGNNSQQKTL